MAEIASRRGSTGITLLRVLLGIAFSTIGAAKLTGTLNTVQTFAAIGWGQWFRYVTGMVDITGALLVFVPRWTSYGALLLACTVGFAAVLSLTRPRDLVPALALTLMSGTVAYLTGRRPREAS